VKGLVEWCIGNYPDEVSQKDREKVLGKDKKKTQIRDDIYDPIKVEYDEDGVLRVAKKTKAAKQDPRIFSCQRTE